MLLLKQKNIWFCQPHKIGRPHNPSLGQKEIMNGN